MSIKVSIKKWGTVKGKQVCLIKLKNSGGSYVELTNYGAGIVSVVVPDRNRKPGHVVIGFKDLKGYLDDQCYIGSSIGRFANRIANAVFSLNGQQYKLEANDMGNSNHSGSTGCHAKVFDFSISRSTVVFSLLMPDGEGGFPGNMKLNISYQWTEQDQLKINYQAVCDKETIANFTNHAYFNLSGEQQNILNHTVSINADQLLETDEKYIPTGKLSNDPCRMLKRAIIADKIRETGIKGFNQYYILNKTNGVEPAAVLEHEKSGRRLSIYTTYPGLMFYTGDYLKSNHAGKSVANYKGFDGLCLECQLYPDAPNHQSFPTAVLQPEERYDQEIIYQFSIIPDAEQNLQ
jgi:aldose 1-epimerase